MEYSFHGHFILKILNEFHKTDIMCGFTIHLILSIDNESSYEWNKGASAGYDTQKHA